MPGVKLSTAARELGVSKHTIHRWRREGKIRAERVGAFGKYRYHLDEGLTESTPTVQSRGHGIIYARVSTKKQTSYLQNQIARLQERYPGHEVFSDVASGLNFKRKGFKKVLERCMQGGVSEVCVTHKDRLCRFAFDLVRHILKKHGTRIIVDESDAAPSPDTELSEDIISIVTVFGARLHGARGGRKKKRGSASETREDGGNDASLH